jgi:tRNA nucleotidyltransferase (CCA-adding enzyme)
LQQKSWDWEAGPVEAARPDEILLRLRAAGYEAYYVGGCVRDTLLGRPVHDWDIATAAEPARVQALFPRTVPTGLRHGTVTVLTGSGQAEVTTFRVDGDYRDGRHPASVRFVRTLREDLSRRDFTVNAMAMDEAGSLTDLFGGRDDLARRLIRCVGEPETRFREDALRMLRAYRFSAQLGFEVEKDTEAAIFRCAGRTAALSRERVRDELQKTLLSDRPETVGRMAAAGLLAPFGIAAGDGWERLRQVPPEPNLRWAMLKLCAPACALASLRLPAKTAALAETAAQNARPGRTRLEWKRLAARLGWPAAEAAAGLTGERDAVRELRASGECVSLKELAVTGRDFPELAGRAVGQTLDALLQHVLEHPEDNTRAALLARAKTIRPGQA